MARIKAGKTTRKRHKKIIKLAKGYFGRKSTNYKIANQAVMKSGVYAYVGRKRRKRDFRKLWIIRINAAARANNTTYSRLINGLKQKDIQINRKMLAEMAVNDPKAFTKLVETINEK
ncbi:MAG: 50S ribosomal protein L20 [Clostridium sp.]